MKSNNDLRENLDFANKFFRNKNFVKAEKLKATVHQNCKWRHSKLS